MRKLIPNQIVCSLGRPTMRPIHCCYSTRLNRNRWTVYWRMDWYSLREDGRWRIQPDSLRIGGSRATACEQEFWFGLSRFTRENPSQRVCLAGPQHDVNITLMLFNTRGQQVIWFGIPRLMQEVPNYRVRSLRITRFMRKTPSQRVTSTWCDRYIYHWCHLTHWQKRGILLLW